MTQNRQLRSIAVLLALGLPLAASCAKEENTFDGGSDDESGASGGSSSHAGSSVTAGTTSSAFGGTATSGGKSSGGASSGGKAGIGGQTGGASGSGGTGGATGVPPDVLERASAVVYYQTSTPNPMESNIMMKLHIKNQSADPLPMKDVKIRYWFTAEAAPTLTQYYVAKQLMAIQPTFVDDGANSHALMTFGGGSIEKGGDYNASEIQLAIINNQTPLDQSNDFSFDPTASTDQPNPKITLYLDDRLIWGCEPRGACADDGAGGAAGAGGASQAGGAAGMSGLEAGASVGGAAPGAAGAP